MQNDKLKDFIFDNLESDTYKLALRDFQDYDFDYKFALNQILARQKLNDKMPDWSKNLNLTFPNIQSIEQCSSKYTAEFKSKLVNYKSSCDLTAGFGIDSYFLSSMSEHHSIVEINKELLEIGRNNYKELGIKNVKFFNLDATEFLTNCENYDLIYIDPSRRNDAKGKTILIENSEPDLIKLMPLLRQKTKKLMIKLSPMLDINYILEKFNNINDLYAIAINNDLKELLLIIDFENIEMTRYHAINLGFENIISEFHFANNEVETEIKYSNPENLIYEPNNSIMKLKPFSSIIQNFEKITKLHPNSHLFTSNEYYHNFPGNIYRTIDIAKPDFSIFAKKHNLTSANIKVRNFSKNVEEIRKRTKLKDGGKVYIFATTLLNNKEILLLCEKFHP